MRYLAVLLLSVSLLTSCENNSKTVPSTHSSVDAYSLELSNANPKPGEQLNLVYPEDIYGYEADLIVELEQQTDDGNWELVAKLVAPSTPNSKPGVITPEEKDVLVNPVGIVIGGPLSIVLPSKMNGKYRIVDTVTSPHASNNSLKTLAVEFNVPKK